MTASTAQNRRPPHDGAEARHLRRAAGLVLLFNGLLVAFVFLKPVSDVTLERVMNSIRNGLGMRETEIAREPS